MQDTKIEKYNDGIYTVYFKGERLGVVRKKGNDWIASNYTDATKNTGKTRKEAVKRMIRKYKGAL